MFNDNIKKTGAMVECTGYLLKGEGFGQSLPEGWGLSRVLLYAQYFPTHCGDFVRTATVKWKCTRHQTKGLTIPLQNLYSIGIETLLWELVSSLYNPQPIKNQ